MDIDDRVGVQILGALEAPVGEPVAEVPTRFIYNPRDPLAVSLLISVGPGEHRHWDIARDLLHFGINAPMPPVPGDVSVTPHPTDPDESILIDLYAPSGIASIRYPTADVRMFIDRSVDLVAIGEENVWTDTANACLEMFSQSVTDEAEQVLHNESD